MLNALKSTVPHAWRNRVSGCLTPGMARCFTFLTFLTFLTLLAFLTGCAGPRLVPAVYDFGPGIMQASAPSVQTAKAPLTLPPLVLADITASPGLDGVSVLYRLVYADALQPRPYALARWSMPPAQLIRLRLRDRLAERRTVLNPGELLPPVPSRLAASAPAPAPTALSAIPSTLRLELEEFSQLFDTPGHSTGLLRIRATLLPGMGTASPVPQPVQRSFIVRQNAPTQDASGGVHALAIAVDQWLPDLEAWLDAIAR